MSKIKYQNKFKVESMRNQNWDYSWNGAYFVTIVTKNRNHFFGEIANSLMILNEIGKIAMRFWFKIPKHYPFIKIDRFVIMPNHIHGILWIDNPKNYLAIDNKTNKNNGDLHINETLGNDIISGNDRDKACLVSNRDQTSVNNPNDINDHQSFDFINRDQTSVNNPNDINDSQSFGLNNHDQSSVNNSNDDIDINNHLKNRMNFQNPGKQSLSSVLGSYKSVVTKNAKSINVNFAWQSGFHDQIIHDENHLNNVRKYILNNPVKWDEYKE